MPDGQELPDWLSYSAVSPHAGIYTHYSGPLLLVLGDARADVVVRNDDRWRSGRNGRTYWNCP